MLTSKERKAVRMTRAYDENVLVSERTYNAWLGGMVLYGLLINLIICYKTQYSIPYMIESIGPVWFYIGYVVSCIVGTIMSHRSTEPLISFLGYNLIAAPMGYIISLSVYLVGGVNSEIVSKAFLLTITITFLMVVASTTRPEWFANLGFTLLAVLVAYCIASLILFLIGVDFVIWDYIGAGLFAMYIGYDVYRAQAYPRTIDNAIDCAIDIYLDVINLFIRILRILAASKSSSGRRR